MDLATAAALVRQEEERQLKRARDVLHAEERRLRMGLTPPKQLNRGKRAERDERDRATPKNTRRILATTPSPSPRKEKEKRRSMRY